MKKQMIFATIVTIAGFLFMSGQVVAGPANTLNWGHQLNATETACPTGIKVLDISYKLSNSLDSGTGLNNCGTAWWAVTDYVLQVKVVDLGGNQYCATVKNQGSFESVGGDGPGCAENSNCGLLEGYLELGIVGTFQGGHTMTFTSENFNSDGLRTQGSIGKFDHNCDPCTGTCDGAGVTRWMSLYFPNYTSFSYDWWGWVYHAGNNGSWVNADNANEGNITGN